jgi:hypothetical protein
VEGGVAVEATVGIGKVTESGKLAKSPRTGTLTAMETRKWQVEVSKKGHRQYVYFVTNDEVKARDDAAKGKGGSMAELAMFDNPMVAKDLRDEALLVRGLCSYLGTLGYLVGELRETNLIPPGLSENWVGGWDGNYAFRLNFEDLGPTS